MNLSFPLKRLCFCALLLLSTALTAAERSAPELTVQGPRGERAPLSIVEFNTQVLFFEDLAETTITVTFFNPSKRPIEGEFAMPLPPGATVSGYALDVKGKMRESSVVEKERARFAYESIKRQMIDPGFVEREEGNVYRTKIFPIPANGTKAVRLSYCETVNASNGRLDYRLPLPKLRTPTCKLRIEHLQDKPLIFPKLGNLSFENKDQGIYEADASKQVLPPELVVRIPKPKDTFIVNAGEYAYLYRTPKSGEIKIIPDDTKTLHLVWDCSESGRQRNQTKEFAFLETLFQKHRDLTVRLSLLRLTPDPGGEFKIKNGDWSKLKEMLRDIFYDGANDLAAFNPNNLPTLVFSDGHSHYGRLQKSWPSPVSLVDSLGAASSYWIKQAQLTEGNYFNLTAKSPLSPPAHATRAFLTKDDLKAASPLMKEYHDGRIVRMIRVHWAQAHLLNLEADFIPNTDKIIAHCKEHHLVSDFTSLIVLERFSDYVRYQIPPPEPDLLKRYQEQIARKKKTTKSYDPIQIIWQNRKSWHGVFYPWQERLLMPAVRRLFVWKNALNTTFEPSELNPKTLNQLTELEKEITAVLKTRRESPFTLDEDYRVWLEQLGKTAQKIQDLHALPAGVVSPDKKISVAVNGLVKFPGKIKSSDDLTLLVAVKKAGGISRFGSGSRISIYRSGKKTTYNTLSKEYRDIPLKPGDLIVVEQENSYSQWDDNVDPFSSEITPRRSVDHRDAPAIVENPAGGLGAAGGASGDSDPFGGPAGEPKTPNQVSFPGIPPASGNILNFIKEAVEVGKEDPETSYRKLRLKARYSDQFYLELADFLFEKKQAVLARRILSNLIEGPTPQPAAYRKWAYLLAKHGDWQGAQRTLNAISRHHPDDQAISLDQAWVASHLHQNDNQKVHLQYAIDSFATSRSGSKNLAELALVGLRNTDANNKLPLDLRFVISPASGQDLNLRLTEPTDTIVSFAKWPGISQIGSRSHEAVGIAEYALRRAVPGKYTLSYRSETPQIVRIQVYRNWDRPNQSLATEKIIFLPPSKNGRELMSYNFQLK